MGTSSSGAIESIGQMGVSVHDIPGYVTPTIPGAQPRRLTKNQKYQPRMSPLLRGMVCNTDIVLALMNMKYDDHDLLVLQNVANEPYESLPVVTGGPIVRIPQPWA